MSFKRKNVKLVDHEQSLKEKYLQLRQNQQKTTAQESIQQKREDQDGQKLDLAKKVLMASGVKQPEPEKKCRIQEANKKTQDTAGRATRKHRG